MHHTKTVILKHLIEHSLKQSGKKLTKEEQDIQTHSEEVMGTIIQSAGKDIGTKLASIICQIISKVRNIFTRCTYIYIIATKICVVEIIMGINK